LITESVRKEAIETFVAGFRFFYRSTSDQLTFLFSLLRQKDVGSKELLNILFDKLADWASLSEILTSSSSCPTDTLNTNSTLTSQSSTSSIMKSLSMPKKGVSSKSIRKSNDNSTSTSNNNLSISSSNEVISKQVIPDDLSFELFEILISSALEEAAQKLTMYFINFLFNFTIHFNYLFLITFIFLTI
jgi:hypothetical protein